MAISKVKHAGNKFEVEVTAIGEKPVPVNLLVYFSDRTTMTLHHNISCWEKGENTMKISFQTDKKVRALQLGSTYDADVNMRDNLYFMK